MQRPASITINQNQTSSKTASGYLSSDFGWSAYFGPWPGVSSDLYLNTGLPYGGVGVAGNFRFAPPPGGADVASYRYSVNGGEFQDIAAGTDGRAAFTFTPTSTGYHWFEVYAVAPDGTLSDIPGYYDFTVAE